MKRFLTPLAALVLAGPVWAQDAGDGSGGDTNGGPAQSGIADLLERLESETQETPARDNEGASGGLSLRGDDGSELDTPVDGSGQDGAGNDTPGEVTDESEVETALAGDAPEDAPDMNNSGDEITDASTTGDDADPDAAEPETADAAAYGLSPATPFLTSTQYVELRPASTGEALELIWSIRRESVAGEAMGEAVPRTLVIAPGFVRDESPDRISVYDFLTSRHLEINAEAGTMTNTAFAAEVRRRLDTYLGLSQGGRLDDIPLGPDRSFDRFWLEAAMGIRREPAPLTYEYEAGALSVQRAGGVAVLSARFAVEDLGNAHTSTGDGPETARDDDVETRRDGISEAARPIDLSSGESVVFDLSQAARPINLDLNDISVNYPDGNPAEQAQAEVLRRWMRHALPIHPDALGALEGAPRIPEEFAFFVVSPESPEGRREVWTLQSIETIEPGFRLTAGLGPSFDGHSMISERLVPAALSAIEDGNTEDPQRFLDEIEIHRAAGDRIRAYLVSLQELNHHGPCPPVGVAARRPVCAEVSRLVSAGLGDSAFEQFFSLVNGPAGTGNEQMVATMEAYRSDNNLAGAAARVLSAKALLAWAARDPEDPPADLSPFELLAEALEIDPFASSVWWETGNALLILRDPLSGWTVFDTGRSVLAPDAVGVLQQADALEDRLRILAPEFFLPR